VVRTRMGSWEMSDLFASVSEDESLDLRGRNCIVSPPVARGESPPVGGRGATGDLLTVDSSRFTDRPTPVGDPPAVRDEQLD